MFNNSGILLRLCNDFKSAFVGLLLIAISVNGFSQEVVGFGEFALSSKQLQYGKYTGRITPIVNLKDQYTTDFSVTIELQWFDRKNNPVPNLDDDKILIYLADNANNLVSYCNSISMKFKDDRKDGEHLIPSIQIKPEAGFVISQMPEAEGLVNTRSNPLNISMHEYFAGNISIEVILYFLKKKKGEVLLIDQTQLNSWTFRFPAQTTKDGQSCRELLRKYESDFNQSKPGHSLTRLQNKYNLWANDKNRPQSDWQNLLTQVNEYRNSLNQLTRLLRKIETDKDTLICEGLVNYKKWIKNIVKEKPKIDALHNDITLLLTGDSGNTISSTGGTIPPYAMLENIESMNRIWFALFQLDFNDDYKPGENPGLIRAYQDTALALSVTQDSLVNLKAELNDTEKKHYGEFMEIYTEVDSMLKAMAPDDKAIQDNTVAVIDGHEEEDSGWPIMWISIPIILVLLVLVGLYKFTSIFHRGKGMKDKLNN